MTINYRRYKIIADGIEQRWSMKNELWLTRKGVDDCLRYAMDCLDYKEYQIEDRDGNIIETHYRCPECDMFDCQTCELPPREGTGC